MKDITIRIVTAAIMALLSLSSNLSLSAFSKEHLQPTALAMIQPTADELISEKFVKVSVEDCADQVSRYNLWPGSEYIMGQANGEHYEYHRVRVRKTFEEEHKVLWIFKYSKTIAEIMNLDTGQECTVDCDTAIFFWPKAPFQSADAV
ncbi:MAG: hypothetical protein HUJ54_13100 [Erysipelotrichaceae bacterium]|nr:hypothetical protein [Erysipelotrichaceae bacterium]